MPVSTGRTKKYAVERWLRKHQDTWFKTGDVCAAVGASNNVVTSVLRELRLNGWVIETQRCGLVVEWKVVSPARKSETQKEG